MSPDFEVEQLDLADHRVIPLQRNAAFPRGYHGVYAFDPDPDPHQLANGRRTAAQLIRLIGDPSSSAPDGMAWRIADPSNPNFDEVVPKDILADQSKIAPLREFRKVPGGSWKQNRKQ